MKECKRVRINFDKPGKGSWHEDSETKLDNVSGKRAKEKNEARNVGGSQMRSKNDELIRNPAAWTKKGNIKGGKENVAGVHMERSEKAGKE